MHRIEFPSNMKDCQFVYTGDFVVWKRQDEPFIRYADVKWLQENSKFRKSLRIKDNDQTVRTKIISLADYLPKDTKDSKTSHLVTIDAADVA